MSDPPQTDRERVRGFFHDPERYERTRYRGAVMRARAARASRCFGALLPDPVGNQRVLEVGAGTGRFTRRVLERGFQVTATDVNVEMLAYLDRTLASYPARGACRFAGADAFALPWADGTFDAVVCMGLVGRFSVPEDQAVVLRELARVVRPGGWLLFNMRNPRTPFSRWRGKGGIGDRELRREGAAMGFAIDARRRVHFLDRGAAWRWPLWLAWLLVRADPLAACVPGLPAHNVLYRAHRLAPAR